MADETMPASEAVRAVRPEDGKNSYELAFHILPTVAEGEVTGVFTTLKSLITTAGGESFDEEAPERVDLAYDIEKAIDGKRRRFHSAYFGWVRFRLSADAVETLTEEVSTQPEVLRHLLLRLTKQEEQAPFRFHEGRKESKVRVVEDKEVLSKKEEVEGEEVKEVEAVEETVGASKE